MTPIIRRFVIKMMSKDQGSGITKLPNRMQAGFQESIVTEKLVRNGYDPRGIKDETELKMILNRIDATAKQSREQKDKAMKQLADIMDMKGRKIPPGSKIMGGEAVEETEEEILKRLNKGNKETVERIKEKKLIEDFDPDEMATGGRAGFMAGGMGRRAFLKLMAAGGAGIAGLKSGLINIFKPRSRAVTEVVETVAKSDATGMPEHFMPLVNKIMNEGKLVKESDRIQTYKHPTRKDLELEYELDSGSVGVRFETDNGMPADYYLKKGVPDEMNPSGAGDEFFEGELVYKPDAGGSYSKDFEEYISSGTTNLDEFAGVKVKDANKSKVKLPQSLDDEFASGGIARMLGE